MFLDNSTLFDLYTRLQLKAPQHTIFSIPAAISDEEATRKFRDILGKVTDKEGRFGKKVLIKFEE